MRCASRRLLLAAFTCLVVALTASGGAAALTLGNPGAAARSAAGLGLVATRRPAGPNGRLGGPGVRNPAPSRAAAARLLREETGLSPSQVTVKPVCGPVPVGVARCQAEELIAKSTGQPVRPLIAPRQPVAPASAEPALAGAAPPGPGTPAYLQQAYDLSYLSRTAGAEDTVAVVDAYDYPSAESDQTYFRAMYGLPACTSASGCFTKVNENGDGTPLPAVDSTGAWETEAALDLDAVASLCPNCHILLVESTSTLEADMDAAMETAASMAANQISASWSFVVPVPPAPYDFPNAAVVAATGDQGYEGEGNDSYPAALPDTTAAGGTSLVRSSDGTGGRGYAEAAWSDEYGAAGSGCDTQEDKPAYQTDSGCDGRAYADISAEAAPGIGIYENGNWYGPVGGTSLSAPLVAAYYALTDVTTNTPQWAYQQSSLLNDPTGGSVGTCDDSIAYICNARVGYDGPTGVGSISGAVVSGAPGVGGPSVPVGTTSATYTVSTLAGSAILAGGVYPNGRETSYWWEYGTTDSYGQTDGLGEAGAGRVPVSFTSTLANLAPNTTYHYRLVAHNDYGTTYGDDYTLTTASSPSRSTGASGPPSSSPPDPPHVARMPTLTGAARSGARLGVAAGIYHNVSSTTLQFWRCNPRCAKVGRAGAGYTLGAADAGAYMRAQVTLSGSGGSLTVWADGLVGPVKTIKSAAATVARGSKTKTSLAVASVKLSGRGNARVKVTVTRPRGLKGIVHAWVCRVSNSQLDSCTTSKALGSKLTLRVTLGVGARLELIAVKK